MSRNLKVSLQKKKKKREKKKKKKKEEKKLLVSATAHVYGTVMYSCWWFGLFSSKQDAV